MLGFNTDLANQTKLLEQVIRENEALFRIIDRVSNLDLKNHYIGAGCIAQTIWNYQCKYDLLNGISDIDIVYFDQSDLSVDAENVIRKQIIDAVGPCGLSLDINNQARVHLWYKAHFGYDISPYSSVEDAINTWPTTATSVGVRLENDTLKVYAPFGLNDIFGMIVRANKAQITEEIYDNKVKKWSKNWSELNVIPW